MRLLSFLSQSVSEERGPSEYKFRRIWDELQSRSPHIFPHEIVQIEKQMRKEICKISFDVDLKHSFTAMLRALCESQGLLMNGK